MLVVDWQWYYCSFHWFRYNMPGSVVTDPGIKSHYSQCNICPLHRLDLPSQLKR